MLVVVLDGGGGGARAVAAHHAHAHAHVHTHVDARAPVATRAGRRVGRVRLVRVLGVGGAALARIGPCARIPMRLQCRGATRRHAPLVLVAGGRGPGMSVAQLLRLDAVGRRRLRLVLVLVLVLILVVVGVGRVVGVQLAQVVGVLEAGQRRRRRMAVADERRRLLHHELLLLLAAQLMQVQLMLLLLLIERQRHPERASAGAWPAAQQPQQPVGRSIDQ